MFARQKRAKRLHAIFVLSALIVSVCQPLLALGNDEAQLTAQNNAFIRHEIGLETATVPPPIAVETKRDFTIYDRRNNFKLILGAEAPTEAGRQAYLAMSAGDREKFLVKRMNFLKLSVAALTRSELTMGFGSVIKNYLRHFFVRRFNRKNPFIEAAKDALPDNEETPQKIRAVGRAIMVKTLQGIDRMLWEGCQGVAENTDFTVHAGLGIMLGSTTHIDIAKFRIPFTQRIITLPKPIKLRGKPMGGLHGYGIKLGYDAEQNSLVYETYKEIEKMQQGFAPFLAALVPKLGLFIGQKLDEGGVYEGQTVYPPFSYFSKGQKYSAKGGSVGVAFPPGLSEAYIYSVAVTIKPLKRRVFYESEAGDATVADLVKDINTLTEIWLHGKPEKFSTADCADKLKIAS